MGEHVASLLMCYAHPDDETFGCGGTTAVLAARGVDVHILLATRGDAGQINDPSLDDTVNRRHLGAVREAEARAAAAAVGAASVSFLDHPDGQLGAIDPALLAREVVAAIRRLRPDIVVTFGPEGIYGHPDHLAIHRATSDAFALAAEPAVVLDNLEPHAPKRLFYQVIRADFATARNELHGPVYLDGRPHPFVGYADDVITSRVDISAVLERKLEALACHRTQTFGRVDEIRDRLQSPPQVECFVLAGARVPDHADLAHDLIAGIE